MPRGESSLHRDILAGDCPLCGGRASLNVLLATVRWRCFACQREGGLPEFAEEAVGCLLEMGRLGLAV